MFIFKIKLTRNNIISLGCLLIAILAMVCHLCAFGSFLPAGKTTAQRREYLSNLGYKAVKSNVCRRVVIPESFDMVYTSYNDMQKKANFDLSDYRGLEVELYTYKLDSIKNFDNAEANLLVYRGKIIGGDIASSSADGFCLPLVKCEENLKEIG